MKSIRTLLALIVIFSLSLTALAYDAEKARTAINNTAHMNQAALETPVLSVTGEPRMRLSKHRVILNGTRTPNPPEIYFFWVGIDEENRTVLESHGMIPFLPVSPVRFLVNGTRTSNDIGVQTYPTASAGSPYELTGNATAEFHGARLLLPGKVGVYKVEGEVYWHPDFYFGAEHVEEVVPLGGIYDFCRKPNGDVEITFVFDMFDLNFPSTPVIAFNDEALTSVEPIKVGSEEFYNFVTLVLSAADYAKFAKAAEEQGLVATMTGEGIVIEWMEYLPLAEYLPNCGQCYDPTTGMPVPCG